MPEHDSPPPTFEHCIRANVARLQSQYLHGSDHSRTHARRVLASLRRAAGTRPLDHPLIATEMLAELNPQLPEHMRGRGDDFSPSEQAAYTALTLFALHMQSASAPAHKPNRSLGHAMGELNVSSHASGSTKARFDALMTARDQHSRLVHARSLITLLRSRGIGLDYGIFARDLRALAGDHPESVLLRWGRDFAYARPAKAVDSTDESDTDNDND